MSTDEQDSTSSWIRESLNGRELEHVPPVLYKTISTRTSHFALSMLELFLHSRLYMPSRTTFNDVLDSAIQMDPGTEEERRAYFEGLSDRIPEIPLHPEQIERLIKNPDLFFTETNEHLSDTLDRVGIYCLSDIVRHHLMWAHYGDGFRGISLVFDHSKQPLVFSQIVRYTKLSPRVRPTAEGLDIFALATKGKDWNYEREWRLLEHRAAGGCLSIDPGALVGVVLGVRTSDADEAHIRSLIVRREEAGMGLVQMARARISQDCELEFDRFDMSDDVWRPVLGDLDVVFSGE